MFPAILMQQIYYLWCDWDTDDSPLFSLRLKIRSFLVYNHNPFSSNIEDIPDHLFSSLMTEI